MTVSRLGVELLRDSKAGRARPRVDGELGRVGLDRLLRQQEKGGPMSAGADRLLGWTETIHCCDVECVLDKSVLERVKSDDPKTPTGPEYGDCCLQPLLETLELMVH